MKYIIVLLIMGLTATASAVAPVFSHNIDSKEKMCAIIGNEEEIIWFARAIFSETKRADEMVLVAWVIRNRVDSEFRGDNTYIAVVTRSKQFSGLNKGDKQYNTNTSLDFNNKDAVWLKAVAVARSVYEAQAYTSPISRNVKHFYSPISARVTPEWAKNNEPYRVLKSDNGKSARFAFYADIK